jgi:hypothetical protein
MCDKNLHVLHASMSVFLTAANNCKFTDTYFRGIFTRQSRYAEKILSSKILTVPRDN